MVKKKGAAFMKPVKISTKLAAIIGKGPMPRPLITKKIWAYIKKHRLQHPENARCIILDAKLKTILKPSKKSVKIGTQTVKCPAGTVVMTDMTRQLSEQIESKTVKVNPSRYEEEEEEDYDDEYVVRSNSYYEDEDEEEEDDYDDEDDY
jgi:chromatin remodeling complex protein RSC6